MALRMTVTLTFKISTRGSEEDLDSHIDRVMDELVEHGALDPAIRASLANREAEVAVDVVAKNHRRALDGAFKTISDAIARAGGRVVDADGASPSDRLALKPAWSPSGLAA